MNAAGILSLYLFVTKQPPIIVAALLANVNWKKKISKNNNTKNDKLQYAWGY